MDCTKAYVTVGAHPQLLAAFKPNFDGVVLDTKCARPWCLIRLCGNTVVSINNSTISGVTTAKAPDLRAVVCVGDNAHVVLRDSAISSNGATAIHTAQQASLHVVGSTLTANTGQGAPGGIAASDHSTVVATGGSLIRGNVALNSSGGGVLVDNSAVFVLSGASHVVNNTSVGQSGGKVAIGGSAEGRIEAQSVVRNRTGTDSFGGGGISVTGEGQLALVGGSVVSNNRAGGIGGGGLLVAQNATATVRNANISGNIAYASGGGLLLTDHGSIVVVNSFISNNTVRGDSQVGFGGGGVAASGHADVQLLKGTRLMSNRAVGLSGGAFVVVEAAILTVAAGAVLSGNTVVGSTASLFVPVGQIGVAAGESKLDIQPGVLEHVDRYSEVLLTKCSSSIVLARRPCGPGEFDGGGSSSCRCCPYNTFGFEPNATYCTICPANSVCSADVVSPVSGYWHSSPRSLQMHRCPIVGSCKKGGVCVAGHTGNLCGQCVDGYGTTSPFKCRKCLAPRLQLGVYLLSVGCTVLFVTTTVHFTWQDNKAMDRSLRPSDLIKVLVQFLQYVTILGGMPVQWPAYLLGTFTAATAVFGVGSGQALSLDCWLPQYSPSKLPLALQRQLSYFVGALFVALACVVLMHLLHVCNRVWKACRYKPARGHPQQQAPQLHFWSRLRVTLLVTAFYAYPTLVRGALGFFGCMRIDDASGQLYPEYEYAIRNHTAGYLVSAIQHECFVGWHKYWALGFGLPAALVLCFGVPVGLFLFLWKSKERNQDPAFCEHYGFLFRNYTESKQWWEAFWCVQTVLLTIVSVFHFSLQAYHALWLMVLVLSMSAVAQAFARPYAQPLLHKLHLASTCCLIILVWLSTELFCAAVMPRSALLGEASTMIGTLMICVAFGFVVSCLGIIARVASPLVQKCASRCAAWLRACTVGMVSCQKSNTPTSPAPQSSTSQLQAGQGVARAAAAADV
jgi:hypothetical protein